MRPQKNLEALAEEAKALAGTPRIKSEEGRALLSLITRLAETMAYGEPKTVPPSRHHG